MDLKTVVGYKKIDQSGDINPYTDVDILLLFRDSHNLPCFDYYDFLFSPSI